jgi:hypothetical protein
MIQTRSDDRRNAILVNVAMRAIMAVVIMTMTNTRVESLADMAVDLRNLVVAALNMAASLVEDWAVSPAMVVRQGMVNRSTASRAMDVVKKKKKMEKDVNIMVVATIVVTMKRKRKIMKDDVDEMRAMVTIKGLMLANMSIFFLETWDSSVEFLYSQVEDEVVMYPR